MNKVSQVKSSIRKERWLSIIKECQSSGMTIRAWCKQNNIKEATYYRNLQKLRSEICEQLPVAVPEPEKPVVFQPLQVETPIPDVKPAVIIRRGDTTIEINSNAPKETVEAELIALDYSRRWTDEQLYQKYDLSTEEIEFIESMVKPLQV